MTFDGSNMEEGQTPTNEGEEVSRPFNPEAFDVAVMQEKEEQGAVVLHEIVEEFERQGDTQVELIAGGSDSARNIAERLKKVVIGDIDAIPKVRGLEERIKTQWNAHALSDESNEAFTEIAGDYLKGGKLEYNRADTAEEAQRVFASDAQRLDEELSKLDEPFAILRALAQHAFLMKGKRTILAQGNPLALEDALNSTRALFRSTERESVNENANFDNLPDALKGAVERYWQNNPVQHGSEQGTSEQNLPEGGVKENIPEDVAESIPEQVHEQHAQEGDPSLTESEPVIFPAPENLPETPISHETVFGSGENTFTQEHVRDFLQKKFADVDERPESARLALASVANVRAIYGDEVSSEINALVSTERMNALVEEEIKELEQLQQTTNDPNELLARVNTLKMIAPEALKRSMAKEGGIRLNEALFENANKACVAYLQKLEAKNYTIAEAQVLLEKYAQLRLAFPDSFDAETQDAIEAFIEKRPLEQYITSDLYTRGGEYQAAKNLRIIFGEKAGGIAEAMERFQSERSRSNTENETNFIGREALLKSVPGKYEADIGGPLARAAALKLATSKNLSASKYQITY